MVYSERDRRFNLKYKKKFDYKLNNHGQSCTIVKKEHGKRCPCYNKETGYGDLIWHTKHPEEPECNDNCFLESIDIEENIKAFIIPSKYAGENAQLELVLTAIGEIHKDDYIYISNADTDIFSLDKDTDYIIYNNQKWLVLNPDVYRIGDVELVYMAILRLIGDNNE